MRIGEFFVQQKYITQDQLDAALKLQKDNHALLLGQILVTLGAIQMRDLYKYVKNYLMATSVVTGQPTDTKQWLQQEEIDKIMSNSGTE